MDWREWLQKWHMTSLKINLKFLEAQWQPKEEDRDAAWELYIELLTRIATQPLAQDEGNERAALDSVHSLFPTTRAIIGKHGRGCFEFTKIAVVVLNQVVRPFTARWHGLSLAGAFDDPAQRTLFHEELAALQKQLCQYTRMLADMAGVEDLTELEP